MKLLYALQSEVAPEIRSRGLAYFRQGAVRSIEMEGEKISASVEGSDLYQVIVLLAANNYVGFYCSCPYFDDKDDVCKHVWAALLAADRDGLLPEHKRQTAPALTADDSLAEDVDDLDDEDSIEDYDEEDEDDQQDWSDNDHEDEDEPPATFTRLSASERRMRAKRMKAYWQRRRGELLGAERVAPVPARPPSPHKPPLWKTQLQNLSYGVPEPDLSPRWSAGKEIVYILRGEDGYTGSSLAIEVEERERKKNGDWRKPRPCRIGYRDLPALADASDRRILQTLVGTPRYTGDSDPVTCFYPSKAGLTELLPLLCETGRCFRNNHEAGTYDRALSWDPGPPWQFRIEVKRDESSYSLSGILIRGDERVAVTEPAALYGSGFFIHDERISRYDPSHGFDWIKLLRKECRIAIPARDRDAFFTELLGLPSLPPLDLPEELQFEEIRAPGTPHLLIRKTRNTWERGMLQAALSFQYSGFRIPSGDMAPAIPDPTRRRRVLRDFVAERAATRLLLQLGFRERYSHDGFPWNLSDRNLPHAVRELTAKGWRVEAQGKLFRTASAFRIEVSSGVDWFELRGQVEFGERSAPLPALLAALERNEAAVRLDDGSIGILPEEWLRKYGVLAGLGTAEDDHLRFKRCQTGLLDALLAAEPAASCDEVFERARGRLREFDGVAPADATAGFCGRLREYQREGLGWIHFLREFGFGGCLADDMGLGKTIQVLALLESRRELRESDTHKGRPGPSLVVAPRSLIFNWKQEAARFAPQLRVLDHTGAGRGKIDDAFGQYDLVLTTYGTLRRDAAFFKDLDFDYLILDEAQAIKNAATASTKAARLLKGSHRLALSGTPVENHLGELWSLFEFLNPGMLGTASVLKLGQGELRNPDPEARQLLARALRPFILRRTKAQVARDLPEKVEQTLYCELDAAQRRLYDELRDHYRRQLLGKVRREGINNTKIQILEALLRLRQAAIHPGLIDAQRSGETSAKLEALLPQLEEVLEEGHKALVFSQFTSMLAILRPRLEEKNIAYAYLDGKTTDREAQVGRFQKDPDCRLFLISLKAGGLGLNLTAAEYVFLLDPWWNPAVEMQAIDRSHRIGQTRTVFAYRLIARDTVEEKVLELQRTKRDLADAIIRADNSLIRDLRPEDLALLLS